MEEKHKFITFYTQSRLHNKTRTFRLNTKDKTISELRTEIKAKEEGLTLIYIITRVGVLIIFDKFIGDCNYYFKVPPNKKELYRGI